MSFEQDREDSALGDTLTAWDIWREEQGLAYELEAEDWTPCPKCGGDQHKPCTCPPNFKPLRQASEDDFAKAVADAHFEALLENYARQSDELRRVK